MHSHRREVTFHFSGSAIFARSRPGFSFTALTLYQPLSIFILRFLYMRTPASALFASSA